FLERYGGLFGPPDLRKWLRLLRSDTDPDGWTHLEYQQEHPGVAGRRRRLEVYGSKLVAHVDAAGEVVGVDSSCWSDIRVAGRLRRAAGAACRVLAGALAETPGDAGLARSLPKAEAFRLVVYPWQGRFRLAWSGYAHAPVGAPGDRNWEPGDVFIDAATGEMFLFFPSGMQVAGTGLGVTPVGGPYALRAIEVEQVGVSGVHRLPDASRLRPIVTSHDPCPA